MSLSSENLVQHGLTKSRPHTPYSLSNCTERPHSPCATVTSKTG